MEFPYWPRVDFDGWQQQQQQKYYVLKWWIYFVSNHCTKIITSQKRPHIWILCQDLKKSTSVHLHYKLQPQLMCTQHTCIRKSWETWWHYVITHRSAVNNSSKHIFGHFVLTGSKRHNIHSIDQRNFAQHKVYKILDSLNRKHSVILIITISNQLARNNREAC